MNSEAEPVQPGLFPTTLNSLSVTKSPFSSKKTTNSRINAVSDMLSRHPVSCPSRINAMRPRTMNAHAIVPYISEFILSSERMRANEDRAFNLAIANPPYRKSNPRLWARLFPRLKIVSGFECGFTRGEAVE